MMQQWSCGSMCDGPPVSLTSSPGTDGTTLSPLIQELCLELKQLWEQLRASNEDTSLQLETSVSTNNTLETGLQDKDLLLEPRQPVSPASTVSSMELSQ